MTNRDRQGVGSLGPRFAGADSLTVAVRDYMFVFVSPAPPTAFASAALISRSRAWSRA